MKSCQTCLILSYLSDSFDVPAGCWCVITACQRSCREGNVFSRICMLFCSQGGRSLYRALVSSLYRAPAPANLNMLNLVQLGPHCTRIPPPKTCSNCSTWIPTIQGFLGHLQICSLWSTDCRQIDGWHSTDMPSCVFLKCSLALECESSVVLSKYETWCKPYCKYRVTDHRKSWF